MAVDLSDIAGATASDTAAAERVTVEIARNRGRWESLFSAAPTPHLPQSWSYGDGKQTSGWTTVHAVFLAAGRAVAIAQILERRIFGISLLARVNRGPIFLESTPSDDRVVGVYQALARRWWGPLLIAPTVLRDPGNDKLLRRAGFVRRQQRGWRSGRIDLTRAERSIWGGFTSGFRNRVRNAEKAAATVKIASDDASYTWMMARHHENMRDKGFRAVDANFLLALRDSAGRDHVTVFQLLAEGRPVAGMSVVRFGDHCEYHVGWFGPEGRKLNAGNLLMWAIIREMKSRGCVSFDVGGLKEGDGYTRFKRTMRPVEYELNGEWMRW